MGTVKATMIQEELAPVRLASASFMTALTNGSTAYLHALTLAGTETPKFPLTTVEVWTVELDTVEF